jgi:hypothetical protein
LRRILPETPIILYTLYEPVKLVEADVSKMGISLIASKMNRCKVSFPK